MLLEKELRTYAEKLPELLAEQGRFVLISGADVLGTFAAYEDALAAGYEKCGVRPFLVKRISADAKLFGADTLEDVKAFEKAYRESN